VVQDKNGDTIYRGDDRKCEFCNELLEDGKGVLLPKIVDDREQLIDEQTAYQMVSILEGAVKHTVSAKPIKDLGKTLAGKTGTTNDNKDAWFIGFSPKLLVGIYIGYDTPRSLGDKETGATAAQPIFVDFMKNAIGDEEDMPFKMPKGLKLVRVNYETGLPSMSKYGTIFEVFKAGTEPKSIDAFESIEKH
jgi:penicillin-binding protein 1A